jgi:hypothetical protein
MAVLWSEKRILITVRTYPVPAKKGIEVSCTGGVTDDGKWIRLYPVPYRYLDEDKRFAKYQWITVQTTKATDDDRPESYKLNAATIQVGETLSSANNWRARWAVVRPLIRPSMCAIQSERDANGHPTLGLFKPTKIKRLVIEPVKVPGWTQQQLMNLRQSLLFEAAPKQELEKIPFDFKYRYVCAAPGCGGHDMICTDWEMGQAYRRWRRDYGEGWEQPFRQRFERDMIEKNDTHFYVGNLHQRPNAWIVVGLFYPPTPAMGDLFDEAAN